MPRPKFAVDMNNWTFGAEHELADWNALKPLPPGFARSPDYTIVNSNTIAAQPNTKIYGVGGEINTPPTKDIQGQLDCLSTILNHDSQCSVNHRSNLHIHIRVPGLAQCLPLLKQIQKYVHEQLPQVIDLIEPIPKGQTAPERKRERRRYVSHHTLLTPQRLKHQLEARTIQEFFEREVPATKQDKPMWHAQPRLAVGLRQLLQTDTIEFRHFPGTLDVNELYTCFSWCLDFLIGAIHGTPAEEIYHDSYSEQIFPKFPTFNLPMEVGYQATASHNGLKQAEIKHNIQLILTGKFYASTAEKEAQERAGVLLGERLP